MQPPDHAGEVEFFECSQEATRMLQFRVLVDRY